ncbi:MAG: hypothetical protein IPK16_18435 [Anaerolineales bacterium]|nr:hypothetical protein [Anaerolineales bacterium]
MSANPKPTENTVTLALNEIGELFSAPVINPFSDKPVDLRGEAGIVYLHKRLRLKGLLPHPATKLKLQLPAGALPADSSNVAQLAQATQAALNRYCREQVAQNRQEERRERSVLWRQLVIVLPVCALALGFLLALATGQLTPGQPVLQGVLMIVTLFVGSIALWDVLTDLCFGWAPYVIENRSYRRLGAMEVEIETGRASDR